MKRMVVLRPTKTGRKIWFTGTIIHRSGGKTIVTSDWNIKTPEQMTLGEKALSVHFDVNTTSLIIEWDSIYEDGPKKDQYGSLQGEMDYKKFKVSTELCKHHQVKPLYGISNPNLKSIPLFELEDLAIRNQYGTSRIINQYKVVTKLLTMDHAQLSDCAYYYGYSGTSKNRSDLFIYLADFKLGVLHDDVIRGNNTISIMDEFLQKYTPKDRGVEMKIVIEKALNRGIINKLDNGYYYNNAYVGTLKEHIIDYLNGNNAIYEHVRSQSVLTSLGEDDISNILSTTGEDSKKATPDPELQIKETISEELLIRQKAKAMRIKSYATLKTESLKGAIEDAELIMKECREKKINIDNPFMYLQDMKDALSYYNRKNELLEKNKLLEKKPSHTQSENKEVTQL